jgi:hypothetical protein
MCTPTGTGLAAPAPGAARYLSPAAALTDPSRLRWTALVGARPASAVGGDSARVSTESALSFRQQSFGQSAYSLYRLTDSSGHLDRKEPMRLSEVAE